jgi:hypothetical protein
MDELFEDCRHFVTDGPNDVPQFNSVAYFGGRYELTMQVPIRVDSGRSGKVVGKPKYYLNEVSAVSISPSGQVSAMFSRNLSFGPSEFAQVYDAHGDFGTVGFAINATPVPNFQKYADASRPSD